MKTACLYVLLLLCLLHHPASAFVQLSVEPAELTITEDETATITISFQVTGPEVAPYESLVTISSDHVHVADTLEQEIVVQDLGRNVSVTVRGKLIGRSSLTIKYFERRETPVSSMRTVDVAVIRSMPAAQLVFTIFVGILVSVNNVSMGCVISLATIASVIKKPIAPLIGFACQFLIMPLAAYFIGAFMFPDDSKFRLGLFVLGCCPGGTGSNFWTLLFDGDVDLSITMTFFSTIAAMGMMPLWIFTLGREMFREANVTIPYANLMISLVSLSVTLGIGLAIQKYKPGLAAVLKKIMKPMTIIFMTIVISGAIWISQYVFSHLTWWITLAGLSIAMAGYVLGAVVAVFFGLGRPQVVAVSIETALQNPGVAFVLLQLSLKQPDSDLAAIPIVAQLFMTGIPMWITYLFYFAIKSLRRRIKRRKRNGCEKNRRLPAVVTQQQTSAPHSEKETELEKLPV